MPVSRRCALATFALASLVLPTGALGQSDAASPGPTTPLAVSADGLLPLEGTHWRLTEYQRGGPRPPGPEVAAWLTLRAGRLEGSGGCTPLRGSYARMGDAMSFRLRPGPQAECTEQTVLVQRAMRAALQQAASAEVVPGGEAGSQLIIRDEASDVRLRFEPDDVAELEDVEWRLAAWARDGATVAAEPDQPAVLTFRSSPGPRALAAERRSTGELVGSSGCNGFVASYSRSADILSVGELEVSDAPCPEALAAQESTVLAVLESPAILLDLPADRLLLTSDSGGRLEYVSATPLEGTTWQLARSRRVGRPAEPVTLRLEDGALSGEGPCGAYGGSYATDGRFITFLELEGSTGSDAACARSDAERAFLADLAAAVLVKRTSPGLRILDVRGRVLARFSPAAGGP